jgi:hypothetical protein
MSVNWFWGYGFILGLIVGIGIGWLTHSWVIQGMPL